MVRKLNIKRFLSVDYLGVYVAALAIFLSQIPPLYELCQKAKPKISVNNMLALSHFLGRPELYLPITITNDGSKTFTVEKVICELEHIDHTESKTTWTMRAVSYSNKARNPLDSSNNSLPLGRLRLLPNHYWSEVIECSVTPTNKQIQEERKIQGNMYLFAQTWDKNNGGGHREFNQKDWSTAIDIFNETFNLEAGEYKFNLTVTTSDNIPINSEPYYFTLTAADIKTLSQQKDDYKFGFGVLYPSSSIWSVVKPL